MGKPKNLNMKTKKLESSQNEEENKSDEPNQSFFSCRSQEEQEENNETIGTPKKLASYLKPDEESLEDLEETEEFQGKYDYSKGFLSDAIEGKLSNWPIPQEISQESLGVSESSWGFDENRRFLENGRKFLTMENLSPYKGTSESNLDRKQLKMRPSLGNETSLNGNS